MWLFITITIVIVKKIKIQRDTNELKSMIVVLFLINMNDKVQRIEKGSWGFRRLGFLL